MVALKKTEYEARIVWLGCVPAGGGSLRAAPRNGLDLIFGGIAGEAHEGIERDACSRMTMLYPKGARVMNTRQLSILSQEELTDIAAAMDLDRLDPALVGASMVLSGIPDFTHVPPASRLVAASGATLVVDLENGPCVFPGREIEAEAPGHGARFKPAARDRRGVTGWVERPGPVRIGDALSLFVPDQRPWAP